MGTQLLKKGVKLPLPLWSASANIDDRETVMEIHKDYLNAGADIITTNTFRTTTYTYHKAGFSMQEAKTMARESLLSAVESARMIAGDDATVAGSITSVDDCYSPHLFPGKTAAENTYGEMVEWFFAEGVELLLFETMGNCEEIDAAIGISDGYPIERWVSLILKNKSLLLDGTPLVQALQTINNTSTSILLLNCNKITTTDSAVAALQSTGNPWGIYPNLGVTDFDNDYFDIINKTIFEQHFEKYLGMEPWVIGACCGSTPWHIRRIKDMIENKWT